ERIYNLQEMWTGARLTTSVTRVGGMMADVTDDFVAGLRQFVDTYPKTLHEIDRVLTRNAVWVGRTQGVGVMTAPEAINYSLSGPMLRASGVPYDVRRDKPYLDYDSYEFDVPVGEHGDVYDRYLVRLEECHQSNRILRQALERLPDGPLNIADPRLILPPKSRAMSDMEAMIYHFKQVMEGVKAPVGEAYVGIENPKGELGNYLVSDGSAKPVRWRIRPPSFINLSALSKMAEGHLLSDLIAINASVDIVMQHLRRRGGREGVPRRDRRQGARRHQPRRQVDGDRGGMPGGLRVRDAGAHQRRLHRVRHTGQGLGPREEVQMRTERGSRNAEVGTRCSAFHVPRSTFGMV